MRIFINELNRTFRSRPFAILTIVLCAFMGTALIKTAAEPELDFSEEMRKTSWDLSNSLDMAKAELQAANQGGTEEDKKAKQIAASIMEQTMDAWNAFEKDWQRYSNGELTESSINESYTKALITIYLLESSALGCAEKGDIDLCSLYASKLSWLNIQIPDYPYLSAYMKNKRDAEIRHLCYESCKTLIEKLIQDLDREYPLATAESRGPGLFVRNYFSLMHLSGFLLPVIMIAYFLMCSLELHRSRTLFYSRSFSVSSVQFWWIQLSAAFCAGLLCFLLTFLAGFITSGILFSWNDISALVPVDPSVWHSGFGADSAFVSGYTNIPFFNSTIAGGSYYSAEIKWIPCWQWIGLMTGTEVWLMFLQCLTVFTLTFVCSQTFSILICSLWIILLCLLRFRFSVLNILPLFWPSAADMFYGGFGIGWAVWLLTSVLYAVILLIFAFGFIGRKDIS